MMRWKTDDLTRRQFMSRTTQATVLAASASTRTANAGQNVDKPQPKVSGKPKIVRVDYDVVVVGGGMAGMTAALAAATNGAKTLLVERHPYCGGAFTAGMVSHIAGLVDHRRISSPGELTENPKKWIVQGLALEYHRRLVELGAALGPHWDHEPAKIVFDAILQDHGVDVLYGTQFHTALVEHGRIVSARLFFRTVQVDAYATVFIDGSGDGDLGEQAGVPFLTGRDSDGRMQPGTLSYMVTDVQRGTGENLNQLLREAWERGEISKDMRPAVIGQRYAEGRKRDELWCSVVRQWGDYGDPFEYSRMEQRGRAIGWDIFRYLKKNTKALGDAYLGSIGHQIWPREGRRMQTHYTLNADDVRHQARFDDVVAHGAFYLDMHSVTPGTIGWDLDEHRPEKDTYFDIPYRSIVPVGVDNLLLAGRMLGADHEAYSATRVMGTGIATGQAAGTAAAIAVRNEQSPAVLDVAVLQNTLRSQNVVI